MTTNDRPTPPERDTIEYGLRTVTRQECIDYLLGRCGPLSVQEGTRVLLASAKFLERDAADPADLEAAEAAAEEAGQ